MLFQEGDQAVHRGRGERVAADQQRVEREHHAQLGVAEMLGDQAVHAAIALQLDHIRSDLQHVGEVVERHVAKLFKADPEDVFRRFHEAIIGRHIFGADLRDLPQHVFLVVGIIEVRAVVEADAIERVHRLQDDIVRQLLAAELPQLLEQIRRGDDGRAGVESETILAINVAAATRCIELFQHRDAIALRPQTNCCGETTETRADHDGMRTIFWEARNGFGTCVEHLALPRTEVGSVTVS